MSGGEGLRRVVRVESPVRFVEKVAAGACFKLWCRRWGSNPHEV